MTLHITVRPGTKHNSWTHSEHSLTTSSGTNLYVNISSNHWEFHERIFWTKAREMDQHLKEHTEWQSRFQGLFD